MSSKNTEVQGFTDQELAVLDESNSINFLWLSNQLVETSKQKYVFPQDTHEETEYGFKQWSQAHQGSQLNLYYDGQRVTEDQVRNTQALYPQFQLKDIHDLEMVKSQPELFSPQMPIYWRIDILKLIIILSEIEHDGMKSSLFVDLPEIDLVKYHKKKITTLRKGFIQKGELFGEHAKGLKKWLMLCSKGSENQCHQLVENKFMQKAIRTFIQGQFRTMKYFQTSLKWADNDFLKETAYYKEPHETVFRCSLSIHHLFMIYRDNQNISFPEIGEVNCDWWSDNYMPLRDKLCATSNIFPSEKGDKVFTLFDALDPAHSLLISPYPYRTDYGIAGNTHTISEFPFTWLDDKSTVEAMLKKVPDIYELLPTTLKSDEDIQAAKAEGFAKIEARKNTNEVKHTQTIRKENKHNMPSQNAKKSIWGKIKAFFIAILRYLKSLFGIEVSKAGTNKLDSRSLEEGKLGVPSSTSNGTQTPGKNIRHKAILYN
ncbi:hypothetical protein OAT84_00055 [Gammaproteobacteria bacterium]|nr:hypothetical protein [Gammaproteobacteria bacterium]